MLDMFYILLMFVSPLIYIALFWISGFFVFKYFVNCLFKKFDCYDVID